MGDLRLIEQGDGGDLELTGKDIERVMGFQNMPYIAMFGGNAESTPVTRLESEQAFDFWGNSFTDDRSLMFNSLTEKALRETPVSSSGRLAIERAVLKDLEFMKVFSGVSVQVSIESPDRYKISIRLTEPDNQQEKEFVYIWDGTRQDLRDELIPMRNSPFVLEFEPETIAYMEAMSIANDATVYYPSTIYTITGAQLWNAVDTLFVSLKNNFGLTLGANNLSTIFKFLYPRVGGTALRHAINAVNPSQFTGTFFGGWTHDGSGALPNGTNGYMDTNCNGLANLNGNSISFGYDSKTNTSGVYVDWFCEDGALNAAVIFGPSGGNLSTRSGSPGATFTDAMANSTGLIAVSRTNNTSYKVFREGVLLSSHTRNSSANISNLNVLDACYGGPSLFSPKKRTLFYASSGMTDEQMLGFKTAWRTFENTLNR